MRRPQFLWSALSVAALCAVTACGGPDPEETDGSPEADGATAEETPSEPEPEEPEEPDTAEETEADEVDPEVAALEGSWSGPTNESGSDPRLTFQPNGVATLESDGFTCNGEADPIGDNTYVLTISDCVIPLPSTQLVLAEDGETFVDGDDSEWYREEAAE